MQRISIMIYRVLERINGERGLKLIPYPAAERIKMYVAAKWLGNRNS